MLYLGVLVDEGALVGAACHHASLRHGHLREDSGRPRHKTSIEVRLNLQINPRTIPF